MTTGLRSAARWFAHGGWYFFVVVLSLGFLSPIPFAHAATRLRSPLRWLLPVPYLVAMVVAIATAGPPGTSGPAGLLIITTVLVALVHLVWLRRQVWPPGYAAPAPAVADPAVTAALAARQRRADARKIVIDDPLLARELKIGRPDLPRRYDDGGLVDINAVPASMIAEGCSIDPAVARRIVEARDAAGVPFAQVDDVFAYTDIPVEVWDRIRDRAVVVPG